MVYEGGGSRTRQKEKQQSPSVRSTKSASGLSVIKMVAIDTVHCWRCLHHAVYVMGTGTGVLAGRCRASTELAPRGQHTFASGHVATISFYSFFFTPLPTMRPPLLGSGVVRSHGPPFFPLASSSLQRPRRM